MTKYIIECVDRNLSDMCALKDKLVENNISQLITKMFYCITQYYINEVFDIENNFSKSKLITQEICDILQTNGINTTIVFNKPYDLIISLPNIEELHISFKSLITHRHKASTCYNITQKNLMNTNTKIDYGFLNNLIGMALIYIRDNQCVENSIVKFFLHGYNNIPITIGNAQWNIHLPCTLQLPNIILIDQQYFQYNQQDINVNNMRMTQYRNHIQRLNKIATQHFRQYYQNIPNGSTTPIFGITTDGIIKPTIDVEKLIAIANGEM